MATWLPPKLLSADQMRGASEQVRCCFDTTCHLLSWALGGGWGLALVQNVTDRAGAYTGPGGCRTAWAEVTWP